VTDEWVPSEEDKALIARSNANYAAAVAAEALLPPVTGICLEKGNFPTITRTVGRGRPDGTTEWFEHPIEPPTWDAERIYDYDAQGNLKVPTDAAAEVAPHPERRDPEAEETP
jgi:hypothetical protein